MSKNLRPVLVNVIRIKIKISIITRRVISRSCPICSNSIFIVYTIALEIGLVGIGYIYSHYLSRPNTKSQHKFIIKMNGIKNGKIFINCIKNVSTTSNIKFHLLTEDIYYNIDSLCLLFLLIIFFYL